MEPKNTSSRGTPAHLREMLFREYVGVQVDSAHRSYQLYLPIDRSHTVGVVFPSPAQSQSQHDTTCSEPISDTFDVFQIGHGVEAAVEFSRPIVAQVPSHLTAETTNLDRQTLSSPLREH
jgi:hypothetical protein